MSSYSEDIPLLKQLGVLEVHIIHVKWAHRSCRASQDPSCTLLNFGDCFLMNQRTSQTLSMKLFTLFMCPATESLPLTFWDLIELGGNRNAQAITDGLVRRFHDTGLND